MLNLKSSKKTLLLLVILSLICAGIYAAYMYFMADAFKVQRFRSSHNITIKNTKDIDLTGLDQLRISGSSRPVFEDLRQKLHHVKGKIYDVDLTGGAQTFFKGKYPIEFLGREHKNDRHFMIRARRFLVNGFNKFEPKDFVSEDEMAKKHGFEYVQLFNHRGLSPNAEVIDGIINLMKTVGPDDWVHFHCSAGRGRTSIALIIVDIIVNGRKVSLDHIVRRWHLMGSENLFDTEVWANGTYTSASLSNRKQRIIDFYQYVNDPEGYDKRGWIEWCRLNHKDDYINDPAPQKMVQLDSF